MADMSGSTLHHEAEITVLKFCRPQHNFEGGPFASELMSLKIACCEVMATLILAVL
jgi:hypothetical protein